MGEVELSGDKMIIRSVLVFYGDAATPALAEKLAADTGRLWNEPETEVIIDQKTYRLHFEISGVCDQALEPETVWFNDDPAMNFFRIEEYAEGNISFVDGIGSNTGYLKLQNLEQTATTIAHEFGHTIGLEHPELLDVRGQGVPGIMYPRGTLCDASMQYDPLAKAGEYGGVMDPQHRRVLAADIAALRLHRLEFGPYKKATLGEFTSYFHEKHINPEEDQEESSQESTTESNDEQSTLKSNNLSNSGSSAGGNAESTEEGNDESTAKGNAESNRQV